MSILSDYTWFAPDLADIVSECFEVAGVDAKTIGNEHIESCLRSMRLMLNSEWITLGMRQWQFELDSYTTNVGDQSFILPADVLTIADAVLIRDGRATPINPMSRTEWLEIPDKIQQGRPDRYFVDRQYNQVQVYIWRAAENNTDVIQYWAWRGNSKPTDASLGYTLSLPPHVMTAFHDGLAARLALKFNPAKYGLLQTIYRGAEAAQNSRAIGGSLALALDTDRESGDLRISIQYRRPRRR